MSGLPKHLLDGSLGDGVTTQRGFRRLKREEIRAVRAAWQEFRNGCAYVPGYDGAQRMLEKSLAELERLMSPKEWGR